jgi:molecular chaperone GrpE (heat shock protein)
MFKDYTPSLRQLMQRAGFSSFKALSQAAKVSEKQVMQLRRGAIAHMRLETLLKLSQALQVPVYELLETFSKLEVDPVPQTQPPTSHTLSDLQQEYARLQERLTHQKQDLWQEFQQSSLQVLESLLLQLPTAAYAAQQNPQAPAVKLLPLLKPLDRLLQEWGVEQIAAVGSELPYDPQHHQLMEGSAETGDLVRIRYTGYRQGDRLLYRAKVSPVTVSLG